MDKNELGDTHFKYVCMESGCDVRHFVIDCTDEEGDPPEYLPDEFINCPLCDSDAKLIGCPVGGYIKTEGGTRESDRLQTDKGFSREWYETEIKNTKKALEFDKGISPYSKRRVDYEELEKQGRLKKVKSAKEVKLRKKGSENISVASEKFIDDVHRDRVGRRSDG